MKKMIATLVALSMCLSLIGCGSSGEIPEETQATATSSTETTSEVTTEPTTEPTTEATEPPTEAPVPISITLPQGFVGDITLEEVDATYSGEGVLEATLNEDGSLTLTLTKEKHAEMVQVAIDAIDQTIESLLTSEDYRFTSIDHNEDFTHYTIYLPAESLTMNESFAFIALYFATGLYYAILGEEIDEVFIDYVNELTGDVIYSYP